MAAEPAAFATPEVGDSGAGWGPVGEPPVFHGIPYQPFSRADRLGKAADFLAPEHVKQRQGRYGNQFGGGEAFSYFHEDDTNFKIVDTSKAQRSGYQNLRQWQTRNRRAPRVDPDRGMAHLKKDKARDRDRMKLERKLQKKWANTAARRGARQQKLHLEASVDIKPSWELLADIEFEKLAGVTMAPSKLIELTSCGTLPLYNRALDRIDTKSEIPLKINLSDRTFVEASTKDDPVLQRLAKSGQGNVFATDAILATLMASARSVYSWDILVRKEGKNIYFEKRDTDTFDLLDVDETALQPPTAEDPDINSANSLAEESTRINQAFSQQALNPSKQFKFKEPNPFEDPEEDMAKVAYRYRAWEFEGGFKLVARCEHSALQETKDGNKEYVMVRAFNEWNPNASSGNDWRGKLGMQRLSIIAAYLKNNSNVVTRWTYSSMLAGNTTMKLGFVSRATPDENQRHSILGVHSVKTQQMAQELKANLHNGFGIVMSLVRLVSQQPDGEFAIVKDPSTPTLKVFRLPAGTVDHLNAQASSGGVDAAADEELDMGANE